MRWRIEYNKEAVRNLEKIPVSEKNKIFKAIETLSENPNLGRQLDIEKTHIRNKFTPGAIPFFCRQEDEDADDKLPDLHYFRN